MFFAFIRQKLTLIWRRPEELQILLGTPIVIILIIHFAIGGLMDGNSSVQVKMAMMEQDGDSELLAYLQSQSFVKLTTIDAESLEEVKESNEYSAVIHMPNIYLNHKKEFTSRIVQNMMDNYQQQLTWQSAGVAAPVIESSIETIHQRPPVATSAYYAFGLSVMFVLYWVGIMAAQALREKENHIFDRLVLANIPPKLYLLTILLSTMVLAMLQMVILFAIIYMVFGVVFESMLGYVVTTVCIAIAVGAMAAFYSALNYRNNSYEASSLFNTAFVAILALLGGTFFNLSVAVPQLAKLGHFTPNGAALQSYLLLQQGADFVQLVPYLSILLILAVAFFVAAVRIFPRKGGVA
ncbi:ABC transporter permease [Metasolibacillus sp.]|uniref:ABC transporter permease n=1 Tax=Metasolibacillus sp. TaxID=2703680 RepID=UPI0025E9EF55|nr:ABC transporter permease [Metasolibacillus sp.]MCT6923204.1 ABC transporter permease [Metasolibacillus sp.]MCT6939491.1 ABC transporter permease [Metasolibacillus sp.]